MGSAVNGVDVIGEAEDRVAVRVVVLQRHFHAECAAVGQLAIAFKVDRLIVQHRLALVEQFDELGDAAFEMEILRARRIFALVGQRDLQAFVQERELTQPLGQRVEVEPGRRHDGRIRLERDLGARLAAGLAGLFQAPLRDAARVVLLKRAAFAPDLQMQRFRQCVHAADAHAVQSAGDLVGIGIELAAGVELRHHHFGG